MTAPFSAEDVTPKKVDWLWDERIPRGMISIVAGRPDQGKGLFSVFLGSLLSKQGENVLHSAIEDSHEVMTVPRYKAAGAVLKRIHLFRFMIPSMQAELDAYVREHNISLVVMDPVAAHLSNRVSRHSDNIREVLSPLARMCEETGCAVLMIEHALKKIPAGSDPLNAIGGSGSGLPAAARMAFLLGKNPDDDDERMLSPVKNNLRDKPKTRVFDVDTEVIDFFDPKTGEIVEDEVPFLLMHDDEVEFDPMRLFERKRDDGSSVGGRPPDKREAAAEWLTNYLAHRGGGPIKSTLVMEDAKQYGIATKTLRNAATDIGIVKIPPGGGRNVTWSLSDEVIDMLGIKKGKSTPNVETSLGEVGTADNFDEEVRKLLEEES